VIYPPVFASAHGCEADEGEEEDSFAVVGKVKDSGHDVISPMMFVEVVYPWRPSCT